MNKYLLLALAAAVVSPATSSLTAETIDAAALWTAHCRKCHGADGSGKSAIGRKLGLKDYTKAAVQAEMTDEEIITVTRDGAKDAKGKETMPGYADKLSEAEIAAFVAYIRAMQAD
jgi:cytochrome c6